MGYISDAFGPTEAQNSALQIIAGLGTALQVLRTNAAATAVEWSSAGAGTVTSVSVTTANGVSGSVATDTTTPAITLVLGAITPTSVNGLTITTTTGTLTVATGKVVTVNNQLTFTGTDGSSVAFGAGGTVSYGATVTVADEATDTSCFIGFVTAATGALGIKSNANLTFNSNTGVLTSASAVLTTADINGGTLDGVAIGGASASTAVITTLSITSFGANWTNAGRTVADMGILTTVDINGGTLDGVAIGGASASTAVITTLSITSFGANWTNAGRTIADLGTVTTADINGGTLDAVVIGGASAAAATVTTLVINTSVLPDADDGAVLGAAGTAFSDLFLAEGGVINWDSSDATITQTGNVLAVAGADFRIATADVGTNADSVPTLSSTNTFTNKTLTSPNLNGTVTLGVDTSLILSAGAADGDWSGTAIAAVSGYSQTVGDLVYLDVSDSRWEKTDSDATATSGSVPIGLVVVAGTDGNACTVLLQGRARFDSLWAWTVGAKLFVGDVTAGTIIATYPAGADSVGRVVGFALTADEIYFNPSQDCQTNTA